MGNGDTQPPDLSPLVEAVDRLATKVENNRMATEQQIAEARREAEEKRVADALVVKAEAKKNRRTRTLAWVTALSLVLDLVITAGYVRLNRLQDCRSQAAKEFWEAEIAKVTGQSEGLDRLKNAGTDRAEATAGFDQFISATKQYLIDADEIRQKQAHPPFWGCGPWFG